MRTSIMAISAALLLASCAGHKGPPDHRRGDAQHRGGNSGQIIVSGGIFLARLDANNDYLISEEEVHNGLAAAFKQADVDQNGVLSTFEYRDWAEASLGSPTALPDWMMVDRNGNRSIVVDEFNDAFLRIAIHLGLSKETPIKTADLVRDFQPPTMQGGSGQLGQGGQGGRGRGGGGRRPR